VQRNRRHPYLALFDAADPNQSVASRQPTTTPTQALYLMNSPFVHTQAEGLAKRLLSSHRDSETRVRVAFELAHGRLPASSQLKDAIAFVAGYQQKLSKSHVVPERHHAAWSALMRVLLTSNAFLYVELEEIGDSGAIILLGLGRHRLQSPAVLRLDPVLRRRV